MSIQVQEVQVENVRPISLPYVNVHAAILYPNPWVSTFTGGPLTISPSELLSGGFVAHFNTGSNVITLPSVVDIANYLGMSTVTGYAFDYFVVNNSQTPMVFILGAGMIGSSGSALNIDPQSAGSFRFIGFDGGWNGQDLQMHVARIS